MHGSVPQSNHDWWAAKLSVNVDRDRDTDRRLADHGWLAVRVWEHEDMHSAAQRIALVVAERRRSA
jgi:DNA mismatch endonuclease, patch repair protein